MHQAIGHHRLINQKVGSEGWSKLTTTAGRYTQYNVQLQKVYTVQYLSLIKAEDSCFYCSVVQKTSEGKNVYTFNNIF